MAKIRILGEIVTISGETFFSTNPEAVEYCEFLARTGERVGSYLPNVANALAHKFEKLVNAEILELDPPDPPSDPNLVH